MLPPILRESEHKYILQARFFPFERLLSNKSKMMYQLVLNIQLFTVNRDIEFQSILSFLFLYFFNKNGNFLQLNLENYSNKFDNRNPTGN